MDRPHPASARRAFYPCLPATRFYLAPTDAPIRDDAPLQPPALKHCPASLGQSDAVGRFAAGREIAGKDGQQDRSAVALGVVEQPEAIDAPYCGLDATSARS